VLDLNGALLSRFATAGDQVLNPLDKRSVKWNPFLDIVEKGDAESLVKATIPAVQGEAEEWRGYARTILQSILLKLKDTEEAQPSRVVYYSAQAGTKELAKLCEGTAAQRFFEKGSEKLLSNTLTVLADGVRAWSELHDGGTFSIRQWVRNGKGRLFVNVRDREFDLMCPLVSSWVWLAITESLSLPEDDTRRMWFLLDELASYNQLPKLNEALSKLRKYGGCVVAALQDVAQLDAIYGLSQAQSLRNCFSTYVALRCEDPDTSEYAARRVGGEQEIEKERMSTTSTSQSRSETRSVDTAPRQALLGSEIRQLPDLTAYLKISGDYSAAKIKIPVSPVKTTFSPFDRRE
jgi:type IV secretory pathway TraG/TraD family ATPase VirD4